MKKIILLALLAFSTNSVFCQTSNIVKIKYTAYPASSYDTPSPSSQYYEGYSQMVAFAKSYQYKYSLLVNPDKMESLYKLDTITRENIPVGKEKAMFMINNNLDFVIKKASDSIFKVEKIFQKDFYSSGTGKEIEWTITNETKIINGFNCRKAVSTKKEYMVNVWFTEDVPLTAGPSIYFSLPGLVIMSEDFFWTTELESISYNNDSNLESEINKFTSKFNNNKKNKTIEEALLLEKKAELTIDMLRQTNGE
jgi:GLPGLI family protein